MRQLLAFFEICAHPLHSTTRVRSSMGLLDSLLRTMKLLSLDEADPRASVFTSVIPVVAPDPSHIPHPSIEAHTHTHAPIHPSVESMPIPVRWQPSDSLRPALPSPDFQHNAHLISQQARRSTPLLPHERSSVVQSPCHCMTFTLGHTWPMVKEFAPLWDMTPTWQSEWTESDIRKEECRRLVWSSVMLSAGHSSYTAASSEIQTQQLFLMDPRNVSAVICVCVVLGFGF